LSVVSGRMLLLAVLNWVFFGVIFVATLLGTVRYRESIAWPVGESSIPGQISSLPLPLMAMYIFSFNLLVSGFVLLTLSGLAFFALPIVFLFLRALLWSAIIAAWPSPFFLAAFLVFILEGEAYILASVAGVVLGLSWLKSDWIYSDRSLSRFESLRESRARVRKHLCLGGDFSSGRRDSGSIDYYLNSLKFAT